MSNAVGAPLAMFYITLVLAIAAYLLFNLWSGKDAGMHTIAVELMQFHGIDIDDVASGEPRCLIFVCAFCGYWSENVLNAFEIDQRANAFHLSRDEVMLATVNSLSFPLYILPGGCVIAKLGEYMNQCPAHVAGSHMNGVRGRRIWISLSYLAEYFLVLVVAYATLQDASHIDLGSPDGEEILEEANSANTLWAALLGLLAIILFRLVVLILSAFCSRAAST